MAKKLRDEDLVLNIIINGNKSKKEMNELERAITDTNREINALKKVQKDLITQGKQESEAYRATTAAIKDKNNAITLAEARLSQLRNGMKLTEMSLTDLQKEQRKLNALWKASSPDTENYKKYKQELDAVTARIAELSGKAQSTGMSLQGMADKFNHYVGLLTAFSLTVVGIVTGLKKINQTFAEFDDKVADVQKTTGETKETVRDLNDEFKKINTRTQQEDLLGLAQVAGKLGISGKENILEFVKATDQISVALSEDLGGDVEQSINEIGKLVEIFKIKGEFGIEKSLLKVGSTINDLGANSSASEAYLVEFTKRVAGVAPGANISIQNILGLAATLDQLGQTAEVSGTTFNDVIPSMFKDTETFARIAGMSVKDFTDLLNKDANEALIRTLEGLKGNNAGFGEMVGKLNELGVDGTRATNVLNVLAGNTAMLREQQSLANASFEKGTSLTNEYNIKNQTAAANLDRAKKAVYNMTVELGEKLNPVMTMSTSGFVMMVKVLGALVGFLIDNRKWIVTVVGALLAYNAVVAIQNAFTGEGILLKKAEIALTKLKVFWDNASTATLHLMGAAYLLMRGEIAAAKQEMILFNAVTKANPLGLLIAAIVAVGVALYMYSQQLTDAQKAQLALLHVEAQAQKSIVATKIELDALVKVAKDKNKTDAEREVALRRINEISPEYLGFLNLENINTAAADDALKGYIATMMKAARVKAAQAKMQELEERRIDLNVKGSDTSWWQKGLASVSGALKGQAYDVGMDVSFKAGNTGDAMAEINAEQKALENYINANKANASTKPGKTIGNGAPTLSGDEIKARAKYANEAKSQLDQEKAAHDLRLKETGLFGKKKADMTAADLKTLSELNKVYNENIASINDKTSKNIKKGSDKEATEEKERLKSQLEYRTEVINSQKTLVEQENLAHQDRLKKAGINERNIKKDQISAFEALEKMHKANLDKIDTQATTDHLNRLQKKYDRERQEFTIQNNLELASVDTVEQAKALLVDTLSAKELEKIKTVAQAKKALKEKYAQDEAILTQAQMEGLAQILKDAIESGSFEGLELSDKIFSPEELEALKGRLADAKEKIAGLMAGAKDQGDTDVSVDKKFSFQGGGKTDLLGMAVEDWDLFFTHLDAGKFGINEMVVAVGALTAAYGLYNQFAQASEKKQLQAFEKSTDGKKNALQKQLNSGQISQETYNKKVAALDAELDKKKLDIEIKQAKRERVMALLNIASSTAQAIIGIWAQVPKFDFGISAGILTGIVGGIGLAQAAAVMAAPLPGKEEGGYLDVTRNDGNKYRAKNTPNARGYVGSTSVIVSEAGEEFIANADAVRNPQVRQVLDLIDTAQKNGTINTLNLERMFTPSTPKRSLRGKESGGYASDSSNGSFTPGMSSDPEMKALLKETIRIQSKLSKQLEKPIKADVSLLGKNGFNEQLDQYNQTIQDNTL